MSLTISKRVYLIVVIMGLILATVGAFSTLRLLSLSTDADTVVSDAIPGVITAARINSRQSENQLRIARMLRTKTAEERAKLKTELEAYAAANGKDIAEFEQRNMDAAERRLFEDLKQKRAQFAKARDRFLELMESNLDEATAYADSAVVPAYSAYFQSGENLMAYNVKFADDTGARIMKDVKTAVWLIASTTIIALVVAAIFSYFNVRSIMRVLSNILASLTAGADQTTAAAGQVASSSQSLAEGSSEQAASLEETSASLEEMSGMTKRNSENAQKAKTLAGEARQAADVGMGDMKTMSVAMNDIKASSDDISKIIKTIDEIAFQTNILALNAAVEAARAGEAGAGFAVVADEVRNLAQRAAQAAKETAGKIEGAITKTAQGVQISGKVATSLEEIAKRIRQVDELVVEIATASAEQNQGIQQVSTAVAQMDQVTQSTAANAEESASASEELNAQAHALKEAVSDLLKISGISASETDEASPALRTAATPAFMTSKAPEAAGRRMIPLPKTPAMSLSASQNWRDIGTKN